MTSQNLQYDISDNSVRGSFLSGLIEAVAREPATDRIQNWEPDAVHTTIPTIQTGLGSVWKISNDLRILNQYTRVLRDACKTHFFLTGESATCVEGLEWFFPLTLPIQEIPEPDQSSVREFIQTCASVGGFASLGEAAFEAHRSVRRPDRRVTQFLVQQHFPGLASKNYEIDVCACMLARPSLTYQAWLEEFPRWRETGLYYPLILASVHMPTLGFWVPPQVHHTRVAASFWECLESLRNPLADHTAPLADLADAWMADTSGTADVISGTLDRLAVLMGVKSNGPNFCLAEVLKNFSETVPASDHGAPSADMHAQNYQAWHGLKQSIEETFPPSILSLPLVKPKRDTWGFRRLTLCVQPTDAAPIVAFAERTLEHVSPQQVSHLLAHTYSPPHIKECMLHQTSQRIQEVLWRLGEVATSPHVSLCMLKPDVALASVGMPHSEQAHHQLGQRMQLGVVLDSMQGKPPLQREAAECYTAYTQSLDAGMPEPVLHYLPTTEKILLWRLDIPPRAIIYVGRDLQNVDIYSESFHNLEKIMVNNTVPSKMIACGMARATASTTEECARQALRNYAKTGLSTNPANTVLITKTETESESGEKIRQTTPVISTTLAESVASLSLTKPSNLTTCKIGESCAWKEDGIDPRYAEKQLAENGFRYRDWTAVHVGKNGTQQSRLAAHLVHYDQLYTTVMPWSTDDHASTEWVHVTSSLYPDCKTLHGDTLRQAVESRFMHDTRMLPTENNERVSRSNCEIYADPSGSVGIAYCPDGSSRLEFICFQSLQPTNQ